MTFLVEGEGAIVTAEEVTPFTAQVADVIVQLDVSGGITHFVMCLRNIDDGGGDCRSGILLSSGWGWIDWRGGVDRRESAPACPGLCLPPPECELSQLSLCMTHGCYDNTKMVGCGSFTAQARWRGLDSKEVPAVK